MKFKTEPIDFTGCHPDIAEALKSNQGVLCNVWHFNGENPVERLITFYAYGRNKPYHCTGEGWYPKAEPIPQPTFYIKSKKTLVEEALRQGFLPESDGMWKKDDLFFSSILNKCGQELTPIIEKANKYYDWMLEERK